MPRKLLSVVFILVIATTIKAHYIFIRLVIMAAAGLAGLYMLHLLSGDVQQLSGTFSGILNRPGRSIHETPDDFESHIHNTAPDFDYILRLDPKGCARRLICDTATKSFDKLENDEKAILRFIKDEPVSAVHGVKAFQYFRLALFLGNRTKDTAICAKTYNKCPYTSNQMLKVLRLQNSQFIS